MANPEAELTPHQYRELRSRKILELKAKGLAYPHTFPVTKTLGEFSKQYESLKVSEIREDVTEAVAGRIVSINTVGAKLAFFRVIQGTDQLQIMANFKHYAGTLESYTELVHGLLRRGDWIGVTGSPTRSNTGELSVVPKTIQLLAPCLHMLPQPGTLTDPEIRYRQRYLDLIVNRGDKYPIFLARSKIISYIRSFFDSRGFLSVDTNTMDFLYGGAAARPFHTHHNDLKANLFMRVSPELALKKLIVSGFDRVYEIGKNYRNESIDLTHNCEFVAIEAYATFFDHETWMSVTEELLSSLVFSLFGKYEIPYTKDGQEILINFKAPFRRFPMISTLEARMGVKFPGDFESPEMETFLKGCITKFGVECSAPQTVSRMIDKLVGRFIEPECKDPAFVTEHPQVMCPLAKYHRSKPGLTERFELFVAGLELANSYTELNDPFVQREEFSKQTKEADAGNDEAMPIDEGFCTALEYGLPPTGGWGMGLERLIMFLTNQNSLKEVMFFPAMKPTQEERNAQEIAMRVLEKTGKK